MAPDPSAREIIVDLLDGSWEGDHTYVREYDEDGEPLKYDLLETEIQLSRIASALFAIGILLARRDPELAEYWK